MIEGLRRLSTSPRQPEPRRKRPWWMLLGLLLLAGTAALTWWLLRERPPALLELAWPDFLNPEESWSCRTNVPRFLVVVRPGARVHVRAEAVSGAFTCRDLGDVLGIETSFDGPREGAIRLIRFAGTNAEEKSVECSLALVSVVTGSPGELLGRDRVGAYPDPTKSGVKKIRTHPDRYTPPLYWIPVSGLERWPISQNFRLGDLLGDRLGRKDEPPFIPLDYRLVWKLEAIETALRDKGIAAGAVRVISGFREPSYNRSKDIDGSKFSRHQYGDAVDFVVDRDGDRKWDDLNGDGSVDFNDIQLVARLIEDLEMEGIAFPGGIGAYRVSDDGVMGSIHIDCRGFFARWGSTLRKGKSFPVAWWSEKYKAPDESKEGSDSP